MSYQGDLAEDATLTFTFNTRTTAGAPITIGGTAAAEVYKDGGTTQITAGVTITEDLDGVTGFHLCTIDTSADAAYVTGSDYAIKMSVGTVDGQSVVGETIGLFSIENRFMRGTDSALLAADINLTGGAVDVVTTVTNQVTLADIQTTQLTESYAVNGVVPTQTQAILAIHQMLMQFGIAGVSNTVRKFNNTTTAFVVTYDDATNPTDAKRV